jgi:hypothetical protein
VKTDKLVVFGLLALMAVFVTVGIIRSNKAHAQEVAQAHQREIAHDQNDLRARQKAYAEHLAREAYDRAHPEIVAARKAAAKADAERRQAAANAEAQRQEVARQEQARKDAENARLAAVQQKHDYRIAHPCESAQQDLTDAQHTKGDQAQYDLAASGLQSIERCDEAQYTILTKSELLIEKAMAEHSLTTGDSDRDMYEAALTLTQCATIPNVSMSTLADCESLQQHSLAIRGQWDQIRIRQEFSRLQ